MFGFLKKKLHKKVLVLSALPDTIDTFNRFATSSNNSDFISSLSNLYSINDIDGIWKKYKKSAKIMRKTFDSLRNCGVEIVYLFSTSDLQRLPEYDVIIIIAHHSNSTDEIEMLDGCVRISDFVKSIPEETTAVIDLTSCYSDYLIPKIKAHIPFSRIVGVDGTASLMLRLFILEKTIKALAGNSSLSYLEALRKTLDSLPSCTPELSIKEVEKNVCLGKKNIMSTVTAPLKAFKGETFIVSVFIHKDEDKEEIELLAKAIDEDSMIRNSKRITIKLKKGDKLDFQFFIPVNIERCFSIDKKKRTIIWEGNTNSVEFVVSVANVDFVPDFIGRVHVYINQEPQFDMLFKTKIVDNPIVNLHNSKTDYADVEFVPFNKHKECCEAKELLISRLRDKINELSNAQTQENTVQIIVRKELEMCNKCIEILNGSKKEQNGVLKVFISSTSDMKRYRDVLRERVLALGMYPDMYELWGQGNDYPRDLCCRHVLESDIFICILGHKYGFVEPMWDKSMTEIEYRVASYVGIPILIYIKEDYNCHKKEISEKEEKDSLRQLNLIEELSKKRMVSIFSNEVSLALSSDSELLLLKQHLNYEKNNKA